MLDNRPSQPSKFKKKYCTNIKNAYVKIGAVIIGALKALCRL